MQEDEVHFTYDHNEPKVVMFNAKCLRSTAWYIVPKGPRYKVGDRFCYTDLRNETILEVVYVDEKTETYAVTVRTNGEHTGVTVYTYDYLSKFRKIPE
jgi:hypothetical protein